MNGLFENAYCLTLIRNLSTDAVLDRLDADERTALVGAQAVNEAAYAVWDDYEGARLLVAVTEVLGWVVMFEPNGFVGVTEQAMTPVSIGTDVVGHFRNVNALRAFLWMRDQQVALSFEPLFPRVRRGSHAGTIEPDLADVGFNLSDDEDRDLSNTTTATFALAERITGVRVTPQVLDATSFSTATVAVR